MNRFVRLLKYSLLYVTQNLDLRRRENDKLEEIKNSKEETRKKLLEELSKAKEDLAKTEEDLNKILRDYTARAGK